MHRYGNYIDRVGSFHNGIPSSLHLFNASPRMEIQFSSYTWPPFITTRLVDNTIRIRGPLYMLLLEVAIRLNASLTFKTVKLYELTTWNQKPLLFLMPIWPSNQFFKRPNIFGHIGFVEMDSIMHRIIRQKKVIYMDVFATFQSTVWILILTSLIFLLVFHTLIIDRLNLNLLAERIRFYLTSFISLNNVDKKEVPKGVGRILVGVWYFSIVILSFILSGNTLSLFAHHEHISLYIDSWQTFCRQSEQIVKSFGVNEKEILDRYRKRSPFGECLAERMQVIDVTQNRSWSIKQVYTDVNDGLYVILTEKRSSNSIMNEWRQEFPNLYLSNKDTETEPVFLQYYPYRDLEVSQKFDSVLARMVESGIYRKWFHHINYTSAEDKVKQIQPLINYSSISVENLKFILLRNLCVNISLLIILIIELFSDYFYNNICNKTHSKQLSDASKLFHDGKRCKGFIHTMLTETFSIEKN